MPHCPLFLYTLDYFGPCFHGKSGFQFLLRYFCLCLGYCLAFVTQAGLEIIPTATALGGSDCKSHYHALCYQLMTQFKIETAIVDHSNLSLGLTDQRKCLPLNSQTHFSLLPINMLLLLTQTPKSWYLDYFAHINNVSIEMLFFFLNWILVNTFENETWSKTLPNTKYSNSVRHIQDKSDPEHIFNGEGRFWPQLFLEWISLFCGVFVVFEAELWL